MPKESVLGPAFYGYDLWERTRNNLEITSKVEETGPFSLGKKNKVCRSLKVCLQVEYKVNSEEQSSRESLKKSNWVGGAEGG